MAQQQHIVHSIAPTYDERSRVLVLGTMPSPASRAGGYNYGHPRNRFWKVMAQLASEPVPTTNERKRDFCLRHHIALWDVLAECDISGASDASIVNAVPNPLARITQVAPIEAVFCTGAKAYELYNLHCAASMGIPAVKLPSTSPANAACSTEQLLEAYGTIFEHTHEFEPPTFAVPDVVALEQTIAEGGTPLAELMDRAGTAVAHRVKQALAEVEAGVYPPWVDRQSPYARQVHPWEQAPSPLVVVLCGNGNNGGDGWVAARLLARDGVPVCVLTSKLPEELRAQPAHDAAVASLAELRELGALVVQPAETLPFMDDGLTVRTPLVLVDDGETGHRNAMHHVLARAHVVVDSIMGTGATKSPRPPFLEWVVDTNLKCENHATIAVDVPTGISAQTGRDSSPRILADETITMIVPKPGLAAPACGRVQVAPLAYVEPLLAPSLS